MSTGSGWGWTAPGPSVPKLAGRSVPFAGTGGRAHDPRVNARAARDERDCLLRSNPLRQAQECPHPRSRLNASHMVRLTLFDVTARA